jgi:hypothetical protein
MQEAAELAVVAGAGLSFFMMVAKQYVLRFLPNGAEDENYRIIMLPLVAIGAALGVWLFHGQAGGELPNAQTFILQSIGVGMSSTFFDSGVDMIKAKTGELRQRKPAE